MLHISMKCPYYFREGGGSIQKNMSLFVMSLFPREGGGKKRKGQCPFIRTFFFEGIPKKYLYDVGGVGKLWQLVWQQYWWLVSPPCLSVTQQHHCMFLSCCLGLDTGLVVGYSISRINSNSYPYIHIFITVPVSMFQTI